MIGQAWKGGFGAINFLKMVAKQWLAYIGKGMWFGYKQPFLLGEALRDIPKNNNNNRVGF